MCHSAISDTLAASKIDLFKLSETVMINRQTSSDFVIKKNLRSGIIRGEPNEVKMYKYLGSQITSTNYGNANIMRQL